MDKAIDKQVARAYFKQLRASVAIEDRLRMDAAIAEQALALSTFEHATTLLAYLSFGDEVETRGIIQAAWDAGKTVALPRCVPGTRTMQWFEIDSFDGLVTSSLGVQEPRENTANEINPATLGDKTMVLVPGMTFDVQGYRLGYGGGFYDVFLSSVGANLTSVGLCRQVQLSKQIEVRDIHDMPVQIVVTDTGVFYTAGSA